LKKRFIKYIKDNNLFHAEDPVLLGVSGGVDSVCMLNLFSECGFKFAVAHCNFNLRGLESEGDEDFVRQLAERHQVPFFCQSFQTADYAKAHKISVQMAARKLRFEFFEKVCKDNGYKYIAVAHHSDDEAETFFINLFRGSGIAGLAGIKPKSGIIIHPLLFASSAEVKAYAAEMNLSFREDSSNRETKYLRNKLRLEILPELKKINPSFPETLRKEIAWLKDSNTIYQQAIDRKRKELIFISKDRDLFSFSISDLKKLRPLEQWVYELLSPFGFNREVTDDITAALDASSGKKFYSGKYLLVKDREFLIINETEADKVESAAEIINTETTLLTPVKIKFTEQQITAGFKVPQSLHTACLDAEKLNFPLQIRKWRPGDKFVPLGMKGFKKVSDLLIDLKIPVSKKNHVYVLTSMGEIVWVIGYRIDNRFKFTETTKAIVKAELM
jgi:tRNA(Ile)-lysidine synthase